MKKEMLKAEYTVYFEIFGKKMKHTFMAENEIDARSQMIDKLKIIKIVRSKTSFNEAVDVMEDMFKFLKK